MSDFRARLHLILCLILLIGGCEQDKRDSPTSGTLDVLIAESVAPPVVQQVDEFLRIYGERGASITYSIVPSIEAVKGFVRDTFELAVTVDSLNSTEYEHVDEMDGSFLVRTAAFDGIAVVTHPDNPVEIIRTTQLRNILDGSLTRWGQISKTIPGGAIQIVLQENSDISRFLERTIMAGTKVTAVFEDVGTSRQVLESVKVNRNAIGFVGSAWIDSVDTKLHQPKIFMDHTGDEAWYDVPPEASEFAYDAHPANIARGYYPLRRRVYLLSRAPRGGNLATGFAAYILNSAGQKIFFDAGLIPATQRISLR